MTKVDFSDSDSFPLVEQGIYPCTVTSMELKKSENTGNEYYAFEFTIASGPFEGQKLWHNNAINAKDRNRYLRETLEGIRGADTIDLTVIDIQTRDFIGRGCMVQVVHTEYQGKVRATVGKITPPGEGQVIDPALRRTDDEVSDAPHPADNDDYLW